MINISKTFADWYEHNKRDLPWRETKNPYYIWVSEIILQQTRVNQGISYYYNYIKEYPNIFSLAETHIDDLLKIWQGLGYYSRARNMHLTAKNIVENYNGIFPTTFEELKKLKGVGDYTASAISSISFNQAVPVLDGNVFRVLSRIFGIAESTQTSFGKKIFLEKANELIDKDNPGMFNQAIMEFGALQCTPKNPNCEVCPFKSACFAFKNKLIDELPLKKQKVKQTIRYFNYLYIIYKEYIFIEQRTQNDIWKLLYQIPLIETETEASVDQLTKNETWINIFENVNFIINPSFIQKTHLLSHQKIHARFYKIQINNTSRYMLDNLIIVPASDLSKYSIPKLIDNYLNEINN